MTFKSDFLNIIQRLIFTSGILTLTSCASLEQQIKQHIQQPKVSYKSISLGEVNSKDINLKSTFTITNPNLYSVSVQAVSYQLELNNKQVITGSSRYIKSKFT